MPQIEFKRVESLTKKHLVYAYKFRQRERERVERMLQCTHIDAMIDAVLGQRIRNFALFFFSTWNWSAVCSTFDLHKHHIWFFLVAERKRERDRTMEFLFNVLLSMLMDKRNNAAGTVRIVFMRRKMQRSFVFEKYLLINWICSLQLLFCCCCFWRVLWTVQHFCFNPTVWGRGRTNVPHNGRYYTEYQNLNGKQLSGRPRTSLSVYAMAAAAATATNNKLTKNNLIGMSCTTMRV